MTMPRRCRWTSFVPDTVFPRVKDCGTFLPGDEAEMSPVTDVPGIGSYRQGVSTR
jgi:hypothetical protein